MRIRAASLLVSLLLSTVTLRAQVAGSHAPLRDAVGATKPMTRVRVELYGGRRLTGTLLAHDSSALTIESDSGTRFAVPYGDVTRFWDRRRAVAAGAITGGILGAGAGAFFGLVYAAICEYDCGSYGGAVIVGSLAVGATGALAGAAVGAAIPRWSQRWRASLSDGAPPGHPAPITPLPPDTAPTAPHHPRETGEVTLFGLAGYGGHAIGPYPDTTDQRGVMAGLSAGLAFRLGQVTFGPELGTYGGAETMTAAQWLFRVDLADRHRAGAVPYAIAGIGANLWKVGSDEVQYLTGTFGAGETFGARHQWRLEARWNPVLEHGSSGPHPTLITAGVGRRFSW